MENMDGTVISTSLPAMRRDLASRPDRPETGDDLLHADLGGVHSGERLGRRPIRRAHRVLLGDRRVHARLGAVRRLERLRTLIAARVFQGVGGAMMVPVGRLVLLRSVPKSELVRALA